MREPSAHTLDTIWGHDPLKRLVRSMIRDNRLPHAMLLHGPDGVGKRSLAFALTKRILTSGLHIRPATVTASDRPAKFLWHADEPMRSPDDDLFGGMDDLFGDEPEPAEEPKEPEPEPEPKAEAKPEKKPAKKPKPEPAAKAEAPADTGPLPEVDPRVDRQVTRAYPLEFDGDVQLPKGHVDLNIIEPVGRSRSIRVDQVRMLQEAAYVPPMEGRYRVIMVLGADTITGAAANSLLKFLEEPPSYLVLVLVTDHYHRVLETIRSRCASLVCQAVPQAELVQKLVEQEKADPELARVAAVFSEGRPGRALEVLNGKLLEQRREIFDARLAIDRIGPAALPAAVHRSLQAGGGIGPAVRVLLALARDRMVRSLAPKDEKLLVNGDLTALLDSVDADTAALWEETERLLQCLAMDDHPAVPAPQPALQVALWPDG